MYKKLIIIVTALATVTLRAENAVLLESFEKDISGVTLDTNYGDRGRLTPAGVELSQYAKTGNGDNNVSEGGKCLKVVLSGKKGFSHDFQIALSAEASAKIRKAAASTDVARYILRYDVIFPPMENFEYFNSALFLGDSRDVLISAGGKRTMSVALDLLTGLPAEGPIVLDFADDFNPKAEFTNVVIYLDNIRLVDTYAPGAKPVVHVLQSFEDAGNPTGGATNFTDWDTGGQAVGRTSFAQYTASDSKDTRVTEGRHALQVNNSYPNTWHADFVIPFENTKLAEVLKLDKSLDERPSAEQLSRYTLRWDVTYPDMTNEWINSTYNTLAGFLPMIQGSQNKMKGQRLTYSITLDQTEWGTWMGMSPVLLFISEGPQKSKDTKMYYDNFRLIDTGGAAPPKSTRASSE